MRMIRRMTACFLCLAVLLSVLLVPVLAEETDSAPAQVTVLFTHDLHSHFLPVSDGKGGSRGGYAGLMTVISQQKALHPDAVLVDGGDFSMGSLFQTVYADSALELRAMGVMGYDAVTLGDHEYDYGASALADMLIAAVESGDPLPAIVEANCLPPEEGGEGYDASSQKVRDAFENYGVSDYVLLERGGIPYVIFGVNGAGSEESASGSGMILYDAAETAQRVVDEAVAECRDLYGVRPVVICLSYSGTDSKGKGEDYDLAKAVDGIDVIISGHTHTTLTEPIEVNGTYLCSCGEYGESLGVLTLNYDSEEGVSLAEYELIPIDGSVEEDPVMAAWIEDAKEEVETAYLSQFGLTFDEVLVYNPYSFDSVEELSAAHHESTLGNLISDAYLWAAEQAAGEPADLAVTASGVIRDSFAPGEITVSDVFRVLPLGIGDDEIPGDPLVKIYLTGKDLKKVMEIDASVSGRMEEARLYSSGVQYSFNTQRMIFNRVTESWIRDSDGTLSPVNKDQLYCVVTSLSCAEMLETAESASFGFLSVTPREKNGDPIDPDHLENYIIRDSSGGEVKEWVAVASYLQTLGEEIPAQYGEPDGRKQVFSSWNPVQMLKSPNKFTIFALAVIAAVVVVLVLVVRRIVRRRRRRSNRHGSVTRGYTSYKGR